MDQVVVVKRFGVRIGHRLLHFGATDAVVRASLVVRPL
jgi:hypothetical protein